MKYIYRFFIFLILIIALVAIGLQITGNGFLLRGVWITYMHGETSATIDDLQFFDSRTIKASKKPDAWPLDESYNQKQLSDTLKSTLAQTESVGFLVLKNDKIVHEQYWDGYSDSSLSNSFSMAKSITTMLVQIAIQKEFIKSWDQKVSDFLPDLKGTYKDKLKIRHLSNMSAGLDWNEHYTNPFDITARTYYGRDVYSIIMEEVPVSEQPGKEFEYQSGATQLLGMVLEKATGKKISKLASNWMWKPMGAKNNAEWRLDDKGGHALSFCCFNSNLRDFARFGKLLVNEGNWNGNQILDSSFVAMASKAAKVEYYGHSFWLAQQEFESPVYYMRGILGQYIIVVPERDLVIVRLGRHRLAKPEGSYHPQDFLTIVEECLKTF